MDGPAPESGKPAPIEPQRQKAAPPRRTRKRARKPNPYVVWRYNDYRLFIAGWILAVLAAQIESIAIEWEVYVRTGSKLALGTIGLVLGLPVIALALPAGQLADRFSRRNIVAVSMVIMSVCGIALTCLVLAETAIKWIYLVLLIESSTRAVGWAARSALLPQIIPRRHFSSAVTWNSSLFQIAAMAGPAIGGVIIAASVPAALVVASLCRVISFILVISLTARHVVRRFEPLSPKSFLEGIGFIRKTRLILSVMTLDLFAVLFGGAVYLLPVYAKDILDVGAIGLGWLRAAPSAGAVAMALLLTHRPAMKRPGLTMLWAVGGFGVATLIFGISEWFPLSMIMLFMTGALDNVSVVVRHTLVQIVTPDHMRGRVSAINNVFIATSNDLGGAESGYTAAWFGTKASVVLGGIGTILVVLGVSYRWPQIRAIKPLNELRSDEPPTAFEVSEVEDERRSVGL